MTSQRYIQESLAGSLRENLGLCSHLHHRTLELANNDLYVEGHNALESSILKTQPH